MMNILKGRGKKQAEDKIKDKAGETLVEVMASIFLFLILLAILNGAISYCSRALTKNKEIRAENARVLESLQTATESPSGTLEMNFIASNADMTVKGNQVFAVKVDLAKKEVNYKDSQGADQTTSFSLFKPTSEDGGGS